MPISIRLIRRAAAQAGLVPAQVTALEAAIAECLHYDQRTPNTPASHKMALDTAWHVIRTPLQAEIRKLQLRRSALVARGHTGMAALGEEYKEALVKLRGKIDTLAESPFVDPMTGEIVGPTLKAVIAQRRHQGLPAGYHWYEWVGPETRAKWQARFEEQYATQAGGRRVAQYNQARPFAGDGAKPRMQARWSKFALALRKHRVVLLAKLDWPDLKMGNCPEYVDSLRHEISGIDEALAIAKDTLNVTEGMDNDSTLPPNPPSNADTDPFAWMALLPADKQARLQESIKLGEDAWRAYTGGDAGAA